MSNSINGRGRVTQAIRALEMAVNPRGVASSPNSLVRRTTRGTFNIPSARPATSRGGSGKGPADTWA